MSLFLNQFSVPCDFAHALRFSMLRTLVKQANYFESMQGVGQKPHRLTDCIIYLQELAREGLSKRQSLQSRLLV